MSFRVRSDTASNGVMPSRNQPETSGDGTQVRGRSNANAGLIPHTTPQHTSSVSSIGRSVSTSAPEKAQDTEPKVKSSARRSLGEFAKSISSSFKALQKAVSVNFKAATKSISTTFRNSFPAVRQTRAQSAPARIQTLEEHETETKAAAAENAHISTYKNLQGTKVTTDNPKLDPKTMGQESLLGIDVNVSLKGSYGAISSTQLMPHQFIRDLDGQASVTIDGVKIADVKDANGQKDATQSYNNIVRGMRSSLGNDAAIGAARLLHQGMLSTPLSGLIHATMNLPEAENHAGWKETKPLEFGIKREGDNAIITVRQEVQGMIAGDNGMEGTGCFAYLETKITVPLRTLETLGSIPPEELKGVDVDDIDLGECSARYTGVYTNAADALSELEESGFTDTELTPPTSDFQNFSFDEVMDQKDVPVPNPPPVFDPSDSPFEEIPEVVFDNDQYLQQQMERARHTLHNANDTYIPRQQG